MPKVHLSDAIDDYRKYRSTFCAKETLRNDKQTLVALLTFCGNIYADNISEGRMTEFLASRPATRSRNSIRLDHQVLGTFFAWAEETRRCPRSRNPMWGRRKPKAEKRERARVSVSDFPHLLDCAGKRHPRDRAFVALALFTMCRSSEIVSLKVGDLRLGDSRILAKLHKTGGFDEIPVPTELDREMRRWLMAYQEECGSLDKAWHLVPARRLVRFPGLGGNEGVTRLAPERPITHSASQIVKPALDAAGFTVDGNPRLLGEGAHTLRRSSARALYDRLASEGHDGAVRTVKTALHHQDMSTTEGYLGISGDRRQRDAILLDGPMFPGLPDGLEIGTIDGGQGARDGRRV
jgi:integrase